MYEAVNIQLTVFDVLGLSSFGRYPLNAPFTRLLYPWGRHNEYVFREVDVNRRRWLPPRKPDLISLPLDRNSYRAWATTFSMPKYAC